MSHRPGATVALLARTTSSWLMQNVGAVAMLAVLMAHIVFGLVTGAIYVGTAG